ncbi:MAG TPA: serine hydrolase domain-containing protein [Pyrinomonadaceae bacterium]|nr:serine hydrolase domain-containing protein [Pyrinomonadaceae bacterium]
MTAADVETFLDGIVPLQLGLSDIAGATVSVVKDGKLLFAKGYGYADVQKKQPVSPQDTLFRPGSISKLFTWTAVMQLFEQGKLDLDRDVNEYLDFKIPEAFGKPITLKHVMAHTPGFEEQIKDLFTTTAVSPNLGEYLKTHIPARIYPPGTVPAYSNYATALAGYIVERVSGRPFEDYVEENILKPLNMKHSTFKQPLPPGLASAMSAGYRLGSDQPGEFEVINPFPAGSLSSSATDMAQFMIAHLQNGQLGEVRILKPETAQLMHSRLFALDDAANAMCYGFYEETRNGQRIIGHGGDTIYFHSDLHLLLDQKVGFFVSYNSAGKPAGLGESPRAILWDAFLDRYYPHTQQVQPVDGAKEAPKAVSGTYTFSRRGETSFIKLASLLGQLTVTPAGEDDIEVSLLTGANGKPKRWQAVSPTTFIERDGQDKLVFKPDQNGKMQMILPYPFFIGQSVRPLENGKLLLTVLGVSLFIMIATVILWPVAWAVRWHYGHKLELTGAERLLRLGVRIVFILDIVFVAAFLMLLTYGLSNLEILSSQGTKWFYLVQTIGVVGAAGTIIALLNAVFSWKSQRKRIWGKLASTVMLLACLGLLWFSFAGNLLRFSSTY